MVIEVKEVVLLSRCGGELEDTWHRLWVGGAKIFIKIRRGRERERRRR